jgi:universal stress protein A
MSDYQHILLATDFSGHSKEVSERAQKLALNNQAKLSIVHIMDNLPIADAAYGPVIPMDVDFTDELFAAATKRLAETAKALTVEQADCYLEFGSPTYEIVRIAEQESVDLIVVGSHGRHGLALLLGSTANSILHHAKCDVLAVRLIDD